MSRKLGVVDVPRCVSRLSSPLPPEASREPQTASKDTLDVLVTDASLVIAARAVLCAALATGDCAGRRTAVVAQMAL